MIDVSCCCLFIIMPSPKTTPQCINCFTGCHKHFRLKQIYGAKSESAKFQICRLILVLLSILIAEVFLFHQSEWSANDQQQFTHITIPHQEAKSANRKYATHMLGIVTINLYILLKYISPSINQNIRETKFNAVNTFRQKLYWGN